MELLEIEGKEDVNLVVRMRRGDAVRIVSFIGPMTGTSERIASYTAEEVREKIRRGEDRSRRMQREEALRRRRADPEAPRPYPSWEETITVDLPEPKQQITLRLDADLLRWFRAQGRGYQTLINAVLRGYYEHERRKEPQR